MTRVVSLFLCSLTLACGPKEPGADTGDTGGTTGTTVTGDTGDTGEPTPTTMEVPPDDTGEPSTGPDDDTGEPAVPLPDMDGDGFPDIIDLCPAIPDDANTADSDRDGIGNACDLCVQPITQYNANADDAGAPSFLRVRNIPAQSDADLDGIGDVCDNCIVRSNCGDFGDGPGQVPAGIGDPVPFDDGDVCQIDQDDRPFLGDACVIDGQPLELPDAAGPVGFGNDDDLDQDGLGNLVDRCPRIPAALTACEADEDCPGSQCTAGVCNHRDLDNDGLGDACDTCPHTANPKQVQDGGMQEDDPDGDFVGSVCESLGCQELPTPSPIGFFSAAVDGVCCVRLFDADAPPRDPGHVSLTDGTCTVIDPALPIVPDCPPAEENVSCRKMPATVLGRPGVVELPPGCDAEGEPITLASPGVDQDIDKLYQFACRMPLRDQDFDGIGDACDLCPGAFDPENAGSFCSGDYDPTSNVPSCP